MTSVSSAGVLLRYTFRDSFAFHVRLAELFNAEMPLLLERLRRFHGEIIRIDEPQGLGGRNKSRDRS